MPKIDAPDIASHRAQRQRALIESADWILRNQGLSALTAGAVAARAGIARNSIYRYFASIDELIELALTRRFPKWAQAVADAMDAKSDPADKILAYVRSNLRLAANGVHRGDASLSHATLSDASRARIRALHSTLTALLAHAVESLGHAQSTLLTGAIQGIVDTGIRAIDNNKDRTLVQDFATDAVQRLLQ